MRHGQQKSRPSFNTGLTSHDTLGIIEKQENAKTRLQPALVALVGPNGAVHDTASADRGRSAAETGYSWLCRVIRRKDYQNQASPLRHVGRESAAAGPGQLKAWDRPPWFTSTNAATESGPQSPTGKRGRSRDERPSALSIPSTHTRPSVGFPRRARCLWRLTGTRCSRRRTAREALEDIANLRRAPPCSLGLAQEAVRRPF